MFASRQTQALAGTGICGEPHVFVSADTRQISITNWKGPISNEPFNHSHPSPTTAAKSVKKHHPGLPGIPRPLHVSRFTRVPPARAGAHKPLHLSRTFYKSPLFMQNKPNFLPPLINLTPVRISCYENPRPCTRPVNKPNQSPNKPNQSPIKADLLDALMNVSSCITNHYEKK